MMAAVTMTSERPRRADGKFAKASDPTWAQQKAALEDALGAAEGRLYAMEEELRGVDRMLDEKGWHRLYEHDALDGGLTLKQIRVASEQLRELVAGNPILKRALRARLTYVWGGGVSYGLWSATGKPQALTTALQTAMRQPKYRRLLFSNQAHVEFETAAFTDGNLFLLFDDGAANVQRVIMQQITADLRDPDDQETIWMFRREWDRNPNGTTPQQKDHRVAWYYTDAYAGTRKAQVQVDGNGKTEPVDTKRTMLHIPVNPQLGWAYGIPDSLPVVAWLRLYREFLTNGFVMSRALAQIAFKMTAPTAAGGTRQSVEIATPGQAGSAVAMGAGQDMSALATAGKGYDFGSGEPLAGAIAAGIEVSVDTLLGKGSSTELDIDTRAAAEMRRLDWDDAYDRIFARLGSSKALRASWRDLPVEQVQRQMQAWTLARNSGAFEGPVIQAGIARVLNIADPGNVPDYYDQLLGSGTDTTPTTGATATDGTGQGQSDGNPTGNTDTKGQGEPQAKGTD